MPLTVLVTHRFPDLDAVASIYLWLLANKISWQNRGFQVEFVKPGRRYQHYVAKEAELIHFDTGGEFDGRHNFDHHQQSWDHPLSATGLVHQTYFTPGENPAADELAAAVNHLDNGLRYDTEEPEVKFLFSIPAVLGGLHIAKYSFYKVLLAGFTMLDAYFANYNQAVAYEAVYQRAEKILTALGSTLVVFEDTPGTPASFRSFLRRRHNGTSGDLVHCVIARYPDVRSRGIQIVLDSDSSDEYVDFSSEEEEDGNFPANCEEMPFTSIMERLHEMFYLADPGANIFLHPSKFVLYVNGETTIDVIKMKSMLSEISTSVEVEEAHQ